MSKELLRDLFNYDFSDSTESAEFHARFFAKTLALADLKKIGDHMYGQVLTLHGQRIPAATLIKGKLASAPYAILAQLHGNEPAGLAGIALAMALAGAGQLKRDVIAIIGNPLAAQQYFEAWEKAPQARQETRDCYRCGLSAEGVLLPDMNRIPVDFLSRDANDHHSKRAQELHFIGKHLWGMVDIHTARGNMLCITDHKRDADLKDSPIRSVLTGLADAISAHASATVTVQTLKTIFGTLFADEMESQTGIEAGRHEAPDAPYYAASFTLSLLHTLGLTQVAPLFKEENGVFNGYRVQPRITYAELNYGDTLRAHDSVFMAKICQSLASVPERCESVIVRQSEGIYGIQTVADFTRKPAGSMEYAIYQYDEMEAVEKDQIVAVAVPSGTEFKAPFGFSGIFVSKAAALYYKDPSVGPWPVLAQQIGKVKFCYPCEVESFYPSVH